MTTNLKPGMIGESEVDGHPFHIATAQAWMRCKNKALRRKIAKQILRSRAREGYDQKTLLGLAFRDTRSGGQI